MPELTVITTGFTNRSSITGHTPDAERVVGITPPESETLLVHGHSLDGSETERAIYTSGDSAERIADFFAQTFARKLSERPFFDCHTFAYYALGIITTLRKYSSFDAIYGIEHSAGEALAPGEAYVTMNSSSDATHSLIVTDESGKNLSVLGSSQPLVIMSPDDILAMYGAIKFVQYQPIAAY